MPHDKLLYILYKVVDFVFKGGIRDYIIINKQGRASRSSNEREHHFALLNHYLRKQ